MTAFIRPSALTVILLAGAVLRTILYAFEGLQTTLASRPELVTAVSSFKRVREASFLMDRLGSPYAGDVFHQPPLVFIVFYPLLQLSQEMQYFTTRALFILIDLLIAYGLVRLCQKTQRGEEGRIPMHENKEIWLNQIPLSPLLASENLSHFIAFFYLFNPFSVASTIAMSTTALSRLAIVYSLYFASCGAIFASTLCLSMATYVSIYPIVLIVPITLLVLNRPNASSVSQVLLLATSSLVIWLVMLVFLSQSFSHDTSWSWMWQSWGYVAMYSDLTPNVGIFWYFFIEVFDRFIPYFLLVLHVHPLIYVAPLYLRLSHRPQAYACVLIGIASLFQAYPSFGDCGFVLSMMSLHPKTVMLIKNRHVYAIGLLVATCMLPVMWFLWLFPASGNANFFYNQTLVYQIFHSLMISSFVGATMKRDKDIKLFHKQLKETVTIPANPVEQ